MRCVQGSKYGYIYNFWADHELAMSGDSTGGITWKAMMKRYDDPAHEAYRDRHTPGVVKAFMEAQQEQAKKTKPVVRF